MKNLKNYFLITLLFMLVVPVSVQAETSELEKVKTEKAASPEVKAEVKSMMNRLEEIKAMDKSNMSSAEKKALRQEVRSIKKSMKEVGGGVYLSAGAIIIIVLLFDSFTLIID